MNTASHMAFMLIDCWQLVPDAPEGHPPG